MDLLYRLKHRLQLLKYEVKFIMKYFIFRLKYGELASYIAYSRRIPGWTTCNEAIAIAQICYALPPNAVVVEIGSFLGGSAVLFAGARKLRGSGIVHCIDPFDASGDAYSMPFYRAIANKQKVSLRHRFDNNICHAGLAPWVQVHQGTADTIAAGWTEPIDMLFLDGDQSPEGASAAYNNWIPFLTDGGIIALHNSSERLYQEGHDGHRRLVEKMVRPPEYRDLFCIESTTFARRVIRQ
jgi:MMP 1-O-methyltransferase